MTFWQEYAYIGTLIGLGIFLWAMFNLPLRKSRIRNWVVKVKTEILPEQKRQRKEFYKQFMITFYPEYYQMKRKGEIP
jgi:hypothetical protein